jgi:YbbR domain-containing protein
MDRVTEYLKFLKEFGKDYVLENTGLKILALLITGVLWLSVASRPVSQITLRDVPIELRNLPEKLVVSKSDDLNARIYLSGPRDVLDTLRSSDLIAVADLTNVEPGVRVIPLKIDNSRLPSSVTAQGYDPRSIRVTVEHEVEKEVQVVPRLDGQPAEGFEIISRQITPAYIRIVGAASQVRDITEVSTETVSLSNRTSTFSEPVAIDTGSPLVNIASKEQREVLLTVIIDEVHKERIIDDVPVTVIGGPASAKPQPRTVRVTLFGARSAVDAIKPEDLTVTVQYHAGKARESQPQVEISQVYSDRATVLSVEPKLIRIRN